MPIIQLAHVTKEFRLGRSQTLRQTVIDAFARIRSRQVAERALFKALDDIDFSVEAGEVVGIIGHNGAGKSTLLKLLAGITSATTGEVTITGKVAPLIEVGAGLVGDLTGRENIFLNAAILGMPRAEIAKKLDSIVSFAELEEFIDTPLKRYSSGMQVRLGFAIATSVDSDILIVDEVLAVGDLAFQRKCFDRTEDLIRRQGRTVVLVSHNLRQVERLCKRVMLLDHGVIAADGKAGEVCDIFYRRSNEKVYSQAKSFTEAKGTVFASGEAELIAVHILDRDGTPTDQVAPGDALRVRITFRLLQPFVRIEFHVGTHTTDFVYLTGSSTASVGYQPDLTAGIHELDYILPSYPLVSGTYCVRFAILDQHGRVVLYGETLKMFSVAYAGGQAKQDEFRLLDMPTEWRLDGNFPAPMESDPNSQQEATGRSEPALAKTGQSAK